MTSVPSSRQRNAARVDFSFPPRLLNTSQAAHYIGVSPSTLRSLSLPRVMLGAKRLYDRTALDEYASSLPVEKGKNECDDLFG